MPTLSLSDTRGEPLSTATLLAGYASILGELRERGVIRTANAPAGDYAEWLVARALGGVMATNSEKSFDLTLPDSRRVQVKTRVVSEPRLPGQLQTSAFRSWDFEEAALVLLRDSDYGVERAVLAPVALVKAAAKWRDHVNGAVLQMTPTLLDHKACEDFTELARTAAEES
jgi:hypothetical protein